MKSRLKLFWQSKSKLKSLLAYIQGNLRKLFYMSSCYIFIRYHIQEQIAFRIAVSRKVCLDKGSCEVCHCSIPGLQMANISCGGLCYPEMMGKTAWLYFLAGIPHKDIHGTWELVKDTITTIINNEEITDDIFSLYHNTNLLKTINQNILTF